MAIRAAVVGCNMGREQATTMYQMEEYELVAVCDLIGEMAAEVARDTGSPTVYTNYAAMLAEARPEVVAIATPNATHLALTLQAVAAGVKGIYCEKPMATSMADALAMTKACKEAGVVLLIGHQRRMSNAYFTMRKLIEQGAVGDVTLIRGTCAGDVLSDGTHTIDSMLYLAGEAKVNRVFGQVCRRGPDSEEEIRRNRYAFTGTRYGHPVESGAMATFEFEGGLRAEMLTGDLRFPGRHYQDIEVIGTAGRLWRAGDIADPPLLISDGREGAWRPVPLMDGGGTDGFPRVFAAFARSLREGTDHPLSADNALRGFEIVMAIYESARLRAEIHLPLEQMKFPLEIMVESGEL